MRGTSTRPANAPVPASSTARIAGSPASGHRRGFRARNQNPAGTSQAPAAARRSRPGRSEGEEAAGSMGRA